MMKSAGKNRIETVFVLVIFSVFALSVLMVLMLGANVYKNMTEISRSGQDERTVLSFIWTKVKNGDDAGSVYVGEFCGQPALCFDKDYGGAMYQTVIYHYNGWVYELFYETGYEFFQEDGVKVYEIGDLRFEEAEYGMIKVSSHDRSLLISPRGNVSDPWSDWIIE
ncbi:MAG: DUF4860 domain-containing protein [Oscillospiraceae bacterium]|nr:DUF4860 domain-containing protein [Oscillospiraceae bacterium]